MRAFIVALAILLSNLSGTVRAETLYFIHVDHLNTPRLAVSEDGPVHWRWEQMEPFGENAALEVPGTEGYPINLPLRFPGQYLDKETNLHYNYFRDYDPGIGRYVQSDPTGLAGGINTYAYVGSDPLRFIDPTGELFFLGALPFIGGSSVSLSGIGSALTAIGGLVAGAAIANAISGNDSDSNVIPFPTPESEGDKSCPIPDGADDNFCKRNQESLLNRKELLLMRDAAGFKLTPREITGFNAEVRAHNLRCPKFKVEPIGPTRVK